MMIDYEEALCEVSDVLRAHNKVVGGISHQEACELILEAVRPKGKWIVYKDNYGNDKPVCSCCNKEQIGYANYCSNCGADMRGEEK